MEILEGNCKLFASENVLVLYCIDTNDQTRFEFEGLACLRLITVTGHLSFMTNMSERRSALFIFDDNLDLFVDLHYLN